MVVNLLISLFISLSLSETVYWTEWSTTTIVENGITKYPGVMHVKRPDGSFLDITVKYSSTKAVSFVQGKSGVDYWKSGSANSPYISPEVSNDPIPYSIIAMRYAATQTIEFDRPMANVFFAFMSMNLGNTYTFNQDFKITSQGTASPVCGYWGCGTVAWKNPSVGKYALAGVSGEPHGVMGFTGTFTTFSFDSSIDENWNGFTIGTYGLAEDVYPPSGCVDYLSIKKSSAYGCCSLPSLYCVKLLDVENEANQASETCVKQNQGSATFTLAQSGQRVFLSSDSKGTKAAYFDELAVVSVRSPTGKVRGSNYIAWQTDCQNTTYSAVTISNNKTPVSPATEITTLFGNEVGSFSIDIAVYNKYNPYSNADTWVCTGSTLTSGVTNAMLSESSHSYNTQEFQTSNGLSIQMTVMVAILSAVGSSMLVIGVMMYAGYSIVKKGSHVVPADLQEQLNK
jgi:hypothetical protein